MCSVSKEQLSTEFRSRHEALISLLESLAPHEWDRASLCRGWTVRDVARHLLAAQEGLSPALFKQAQQGVPSAWFGLGLSDDNIPTLAAVNEYNKSIVQAESSLDTGELIARIARASDRLMTLLEQTSEDRFERPVWLSLMGIVPLSLAVRGGTTEQFIHLYDICKPLGNAARCRWTSSSPWLRTWYSYRPTPLCQRESRGYPGIRLRPGRSGTVDAAHRRRGGGRSKRTLWGGRCGDNCRSTGVCFGHDFRSRQPPQVVADPEDSAQGKHSCSFAASLVLHCIRLNSFSGPSGSADYGREALPSMSYTAHTEPWQYREDNEAVSC